MKRFASFAAVVLFGAALATPVLAGIADSPLPVLLPGKTTYHLYTVPFATRGGTLETIFACTSTDTASMQVCVEVFSPFGGPPISNDCSFTSLNVASGANVKFGTNPTTAISIDSIVNGSASGGSARIIATSKKLACTAFLADAFNVPPSMVHLTIIKKKTQKGD
jgi:hypothetical protein